MRKIVTSLDHDYLKVRSNFTVVHCLDYDIKHIVKGWQVKSMSLFSRADGPFESNNSSALFGGRMDRYVLSDITHSLKHIYWPKLERISASRIFYIITHLCFWVQLA